MTEWYMFTVMNYGIAIKITDWDSGIFGRSRDFDLRPPHMRHRHDACSIDDQIYIYLLGNFYKFPQRYFFPFSFPGMGQERWRGLSERGILWFHDLKMRIDYIY